MNNFPWGGKGPEIQWENDLRAKGWTEADPSDAKKFNEWGQALENISGFVLLDEDNLGLDFNFFDPTKQVNRSENLKYLARFIRPVSTKVASNHLISVVNSNHLAVSRVLMSKLLGSGTLRQTGDLVVLSSEHRTRLDAVPLDVILDASDGIISLADLKECNVDVDQHDVIVGEFVIDYSKAGLDSTGLSILKSHYGASLVPLDDLDRWGIKDVEKIKEVFNSVITNNPAAGLKLNDSGTAVQFNPIGLSDAVALLEAEMAKLDTYKAAIETLERSKMDIRDEIGGYHDQQTEHEDLIIQAKADGALISVKVEALKIGQKWVHKKLDKP